MSTAYRNLLMEYQPKPIHSEREYQQALAKLNELMTPNPGKDKSLLIELMSTLIEQYEAKVHPTPSVSPSAMLAHLLEARGISAASLARQVGIQSTTISNVLSGRRGISKQNAVSLARFFRVSPAAFLEEAAEREHQPA